MYYIISHHDIYIYWFPATTLQEQEKQFGSVIKVLQDDPALSQSIALVHALALRAAARCEAKEYQTALEDVQQGLDRLKNGSSSKDQELLSKLYRTQADAFEGLGRIKDAIESLQLWAASDPAFQSKIIKEIQRLNAMML
jgi:tetratricopeptide (TPR) repeat protein